MDFFYQYADILKLLFTNTNMEKTIGSCFYYTLIIYKMYKQYNRNSK